MFEIYFLPKKQRQQERPIMKALTVATVLSVASSVDVVAAADAAAARGGSSIFCVARSLSAPATEQGAVIAARTFTLTGHCQLVEKASGRTDRNRSAQRHAENIPAVE